MSLMEFEQLVGLIFLIVYVLLAGSLFYVMFFKE